MSQMMWSFQLLVFVGIAYLWNQPTCGFYTGSPEYTEEQQGNTVENEVQQMRAELKAVKEQLLAIDQLRGMVGHMTTEFENDIQQLKSQLQNNQQDTRDEIEPLKLAVQRIQADKANTQTSAFSAYMNVGYFKPADSTRVTVPYNSVTFNLGNDFNSGTSTYTCPVSGVYYFTYAADSGSIKQGQRDRTFSELVVNNVYVNEIFCYTSTDASIECQATNSAVVRCPRGGAVKIRTGDSLVQLYGTTTHRRTSFTGFLLYCN